MRRTAEGKDKYSTAANQQAAQLSKVVAKIKEGLGGAATPQAQFNVALPRIQEQQAAASSALQKTAKSVSLTMAQTRASHIDPRVKAAMISTIEKYF